MAAAAPVAPPDNASPSGHQTGKHTTRGVQPLRAGEGHSFLLRKLHSLTGIVPIGAFLVEHILSNFETWNGPLAYAQQVKFLNSLPLVRVLEWCFIFIPLAYHALYGVYIGLRGRGNVNVYPWAGNWGYFTQRITGYIAFVYIIQHVARQRFMGVSLPENPAMAFHKVQVELQNPLMLAFYVLAMLAVSWHFAYGVWLFAAKWGITPGEKARKKFGYVCGAGGAALCLMGLISIYAVVWKYPNAPIPAMGSQPAGVTLPAPTTATPGTTNPAQPGVIQASPTAGTGTGAPTGSNVAMFDPNGVVRLVPSNLFTEAKRSGGVVAVRVLTVTGERKWIRESELDDALKNGAVVANSQ